MKTLRRTLSILLAAVLCLTLLPMGVLAEEAPVDGGDPLPVSDGWAYYDPANYTEDKVYNRIIAMRSTYYEGMPWTNDNEYDWNGGIYAGGAGCTAFAFLLSDAAFGNLPARMYINISFDDVRVGDILRIMNDTHDAVVLEKFDDYIVIAEGNWNSSIHWGRTLSRSEVEAADNLITRYPNGEPLPIPEDTSGTWRKSGGRWWYLFSDGSYPYEQFVQIDNQWYYFDYYGYMATGWRKIYDDYGYTWHYFGSDGAEVYGWQKIDGTWYYFYYGNGVMASPFSGWFDDDDGVRYWIDSSGAMRTGWREYYGDWYYFDASGAMATGWRKIGGVWYYFDPGDLGRMVTGQRVIDGTLYRFDDSGAWIG